MKNRAIGSRMVLTGASPPMHPACHLDTQNTVFDSLDTQKFMSEFVDDDFS